MSTAGPTASVVAVLRDEPPERVARMFASVAAQVGIDDLEVVLAAPPGDPATAIGLRPGGAVGSVRWVENVGGARSAGLNAAVAASTGPVVVRIDARSTFGPGHVRRCVDLLEHQAARVVGGAQVSVAGGTDARSLGIARALRNPLLSGGAPYRSAGRSGPADTVYLGAFRRDVFDAIGGYEVELVGNEDFDLCQRALSAGIEVWLDADLAVTYEPRNTVGSIASQYFAFGRMKVDYWRLRRVRPRPRQLVVPVAQGVVVAALPLLVRRPSTVLGAAAAGVAAVAAIDARSGAAPIPVRAVSVATALVSSMSFGAGVWSGWLQRRGRPSTTVGPRVTPDG